MKFPSNIYNSLKHYLYAYYDPTDKTNFPFYIGRGTENRAFEHLKQSHNPEVRTIINKIRNSGLQPKVKIIIHGLSLQQAKAAETAAIAFFGKDNLANAVKGSGSGLTNSSPQELIDHYNAKDVTIRHKVIMIIRNPRPKNFVVDSIQPIGTDKVNEINTALNETFIDVNTILKYSGSYENISINDGQELIKI